LKKKLKKKKRYAFALFVWSLVLYRHAREEIDDAPPIGTMFTCLFGIYYALCAVLAFASFIGFVAFEAGGTSVWPFFVFVTIVMLLVSFCQMQKNRNEDGGGNDDNPCAGFLCNIILVVVCAILLFFQITMTAQSLGAAVDYSQNLPFGPLFTVPDAEGSLTDMHLYCLTNDDDDYEVDSQLPTVLLESAINAPGVVSWANVQPLVARALRVCSYDRRGYGWSWRGPNPRHVAQFAVELRDLLDAAQVARPLVYVGWGYGGLAASAYAHRFGSDARSGEVRGMVFVDALHPDQVDPSTDSTEKVTANIEDSFKVDAGPSGYDNFIRFFAPLGFVRMGEATAVETGSLGFPFDVLRLLPERAFEAYRGFLLGYYHPNVVFQEKREWTTLSHDDVTKAPILNSTGRGAAATAATSGMSKNLYIDGALGQLPVAVVSRLSNETEYKAFQDKLTKLAPNTTLVMPANASDFLPMRDPVTIARAIIRVAARSAVYSGLTVNSRALERRKRTTEEYVADLEHILMARLEDESK
jgi:pimeloyl-ACP methyl ester carboxylesterase